MAFISNTFIAVDVSSMPRWLDVLSQVLPLRPFVESVQAPFNPTVEAPGILWGDLAVVVAWGVFGVVLAARTFKWEPVADDGRPSRRRHRRSANETVGAT
jgi:ABC-2 type transport system permease protein